MNRHKKIKNCEFFSKRPLYQACNFEVDFWHDFFSKTHVHNVTLKSKSELPNLRSNFKTHNNVGDNFLLYI